MGTRHLYHTEIELTVARENFIAKRTERLEVKNYNVNQLIKQKGKHDIHRPHTDHEK